MAKNRDSLSQLENQVKAKGESPNATCMPGGKILVYENLLPLLGSEGGLAAVLGHEIGNAIGHHLAEQYTKVAKKSMAKIRRLRYWHSRNSHKGRS